ncbi:hypothetical protein RF11_02706 [Thelohanellus kitauei]|uniref:Uncharacterized protein n=1 Tax=Thelohanellus kitauei TaxID=669202 RepID=A0A0C2MDR4_THEKT|nr:hypothetical protein RF11_02706 [Thelohanellus kitauei]
MELNEKCVLFFRIYGRRSVCYRDMSTDPYFHKLQRYAFHNDHPEALERYVGTPQNLSQHITLRGLGHFVRAFSGEYRLNLFTIDGRIFKDRWNNSVYGYFSMLISIWNDLDTLLEKVKPSIVFIRNMCNFGDDSPAIIQVVSYVKGMQFYFSRSMKCENFDFPEPNNEIRQKVFQYRIRDVDNKLSIEMLENLASDIPMKDFDKIIRFAIFCRKSKYLKRNIYTLSNDVNPITKSFSDLKNALKCCVDPSTLPPLSGKFLMLFKWSKHPTQSGIVTHVYDDFIAVVYSPGFFFSFTRMVQNKAKIDPTRKYLISKSPVKIGIPTERLSDVYGLDEMKDKFFTLLVLPLLKPNLYEGGFDVMLLQPINKGVGHFIRAFAGEYRFHLVTIDGRWFKNRDLNCIYQYLLC